MLATATGNPRDSRIVKDPDKFWAWWSMQLLAMKEVKGQVRSA
jgi:hypothetical protein